MKGLQGFVLPLWKQGSSCQLWGYLPSQVIYKDKKRWLGLYSSLQVKWPFLGQALCGSQKSFLQSHFCSRILQCAENTRQIIGGSHAFTIKHCCFAIQWELAESCHWKKTTTNQPRGELGPQWKATQTGVQPKIKGSSVRMNTEKRAGATSPKHQLPYPAQVKWRKEKKLH